MAIGNFKAGSKSAGDAAYGARQTKGPFESSFVKVIEENSPYTARLIPMGNKKILVTPGLVARINLLTKRGTSVTSCPVPMPDIRIFAHAEFRQPW